MLRLALIGCSDDVAYYSHIAPRIRGARIIAVVDRETQSARSTAVALGAKISSDNFDQLLAEHQTEFDAVVIHSARAGSIVEICQRAAEAGKHVLIESPPILPVAVVEQIVAICSRAAVRLMLGQTSRFLPSVQTVKKSLDSGQLGEPGVLRIHRWEPATLHGGQERTNSFEGGSAASLLDQLTREFDLACWFFGHAPTNVFATSRQLSSSQRNELDYVQVHLGFERGGMALIDYAQTLPPGEGYFSLTLVGSQGAAYADDHHNMQLLFSGGCPKALNSNPSNVQTLAQMQEFVTAINENRESLVTGADSLRAGRVAEAVADALMTHTGNSIASTTSWIPSIHHNGEQRRSLS
jgi:predicted dehydrogenase